MASWSAGDRQWTAPRQDGIRSGGGPPQGGILGDMPSSMHMHSNAAVQPQPPRNAPNFRGGVPRPPSGAARNGSGAESGGAGGLSGGGAPGTPERKQRKQVRLKYTHIHTNHTLHRLPSAAGASCVMVPSMCAYVRPYVPRVLATLLLTQKRHPECVRLCCKQSPWRRRHERWQPPRPVSTIHIRQRGRSLRCRHGWRHA